MYSQLESRNSINRKDLTISLYGAHLARMRKRPGWMVAVVVGEVVEEEIVVVEEEVVVVSAMLFKVEIVIEEVSVVSVTRVVVAEVVAGQEEEVVEGTEADMVTEETEIEEAEGAEEEVVMVIVMVEVEGVEAVVCAMPFRRVIAREEAPVDSAIIRLSEELVSSG